MATAAAVLAVLLGVQVAYLNNQVGHLQTAAGRTGLSGAVQTALEEPSTKRVKLVPSGATPAAGTSVTVALTSTGAAVPHTQDLAKLPGQEVPAVGRGSRAVHLTLDSSAPTPL